MNVKPILFNTEMVQAILGGKKTVTRRVVKMRHPEDYKYFCGLEEFAKNSAHLDQKYLYAAFSSDEKRWLDKTDFKAPYQPGDILYVRETWCLRYDGEKYFYLADKHTEREEKKLLNYDEVKWRPSIHMPKEAARIWLKVTSVKVERVQDILKDPPGSNNQVVKEGCAYTCDFIAVWENSIPKDKKSVYGWNANPFVWVIEFERCEKPEPCILRGVEPAEYTDGGGFDTNHMSKHPCIGYGVSDTNDEPCEMCKQCQYRSGNEV